MPWQNENIKIISKQAIKMIHRFFQGSEFEKEFVPIFICTFDEFEEAVVEEALFQNRNKIYIEILKNLVPKAYGKYFQQKKIIYVIEGKGERIETIIHEYLHSIQNCYNKREGIVRFLAFKITNNPNSISEFDLNDWLEIEKNVGLEDIKSQLFAHKDCEDF